MARSPCVGRLLLVVCLLRSTTPAISYDGYPSVCDHLDKCSCTMNDRVLLYPLAIVCDVGPSGFNFSQFDRPDSLPTISWSLTLISESSHNRRKPLLSPLTIPRNAIPSTNGERPPAFELFIGNVELVSVDEEAFPGVPLTSLWFYYTRLVSLPLDSFLQHGAYLTNISVQWVSQKSGAPITPPSFHSFPALEKIEYKDALISPSYYLPDRTLYNLPSLSHFQLVRSRLLDVSPNAMLNVPNLKKLEIVACGLEKVPVSALPRLANLETLNLYGNNIRLVDSADIDALARLPSLEKLILLENPFSCTCELLPFVKWLQDSVLDFVGAYVLWEDYGWPVEYLCDSPEQLRQRSMRDSSLLRYLQRNCTAPYSVTVGVVVVVLGIAVVLVAVALYRKMKRKWEALFRRYSHRNDNVDCRGEFVYDAYICYHGDMEDFISEQMIPRLEEEPNNFRLYVSFRDLIVGGNKLDNVATAMKTSRLIIVLLNADFLASCHCMLELYMACTRMVDPGVDALPAAADIGIPFREGAAGLLLVLLDALSADALPTTLTVLRDKITCLEWRMKDEERCWWQLVTSLQAARPNQVQLMDIEED